MTCRRKILSIYFLIWLASVGLAAGAILWFGLDARIPVEGSAQTRSVAMLWIMPGMATILYGSLMLAGLVETRRWRRRPVELSADAERGLAIYGRAVARTMIRFGLLLLAFEMLAVLRAAGVTEPLGLDREKLVRLFYVIFGALVASIGNVTPKLPYVRQPGLDTARYHGANRPVGWVFLLGGIGYGLAALLLPFEQMVRAGGLLIGVMLIVPAGLYGYAMLARRGAASR